MAIVVRLRALPAALLVPLLAASAGCGSRDLPPPAAACTSAPAKLTAALRTAPRPVVLEDGSSLSQCVERATSDADLQTVGATMSRAADRLRVRMRTDDHGAPVALGYLVGAMRKGGGRTNGVLLELVRRVEATAGQGLDELGPAGRAAFFRGLKAGEASG
jgi:hypothetical protein